MNQIIKDSLNSTFGITGDGTNPSAIIPSTPTPVSKPTKTKAVTKVNKTLTPVLNKEAEKEKNEQERKKDLQTSRSAIDKVLQTGTDAIDSLYSLAIDSEEPRTYEVLGDMIEKIGNTAEKLMKLRREEAEIARIEAKIELEKQTAGQEQGPKSITQNNTIFVGDAKELLKHIKGVGKTVDTTAEEVK